GHARVDGEAGGGGGGVLIRYPRAPSYRMYSPCGEQFTNPAVRATRGRCRSATPPTAGFARFLLTADVQNVTRSACTSSSLASSTESGSAVSVNVRACLRPCEHAGAVVRRAARR